MAFHSSQRIAELAVEAGAKKERCILCMYYYWWQCVCSLDLLDGSLQSASKAKSSIKEAS